MAPFNCVVFFCGHYQLQFRQKFTSEDTEAASEAAKFSIFPGFLGEVSKLPYALVNNITLSSFPCKACKNPPCAQVEKSRSLSESGIRDRAHFAMLIADLKDLKMKAADLIRRAGKLSVSTHFCLPAMSLISDVLDQALWAYQERRSTNGSGWEHDILQSFLKEATSLERQLLSVGDMTEGHLPQSWTDAVLPLASATHKNTSEKVSALHFAVEVLEEIQLRVNYLTKRSFERPLEEMKADGWAWPEFSRSPRLVLCSSFTEYSYDGESQDRSEPAEYFRPCWLDERTVGDFERTTPVWCCSSIPANSFDGHLADFPSSIGAEGTADSQVTGDVGSGIYGEVGDPHKRAPVVGELGTDFQCPFLFGAPAGSPPLVLPPPVPVSWVSSPPKEDFVHAPICSPMYPTLPFAASVEPFPDFDVNNDPHALPGTYAEEAARTFEDRRLLPTPISRLCLFSTADVPLVVPSSQAPCSRFDWHSSALDYPSLGTECGEAAVRTVLSPIARPNPPPERVLSAKRKHCEIVDPADATKNEHRVKSPHTIEVSEDMELDICEAQRRVHDAIAKGKPCEWRYWRCWRYT